LPSVGIHLVKSYNSIIDFWLIEVDPMSRLVLDFFKLHYVPVCSLTGRRP